MVSIICSAFLFIYAQFDLPGALLAAVTWIIPLIMKSKQEKLNFYQGFVWGLIVFSFHLSWLYVMLFHYASWKGGIVGMLAVFWFSCASGIWFLGFQYSWPISTILFFMFLTCWSLFPCGKLEGYPLINPLLPFMPTSCRVPPEMKNLVFVQPWWYGNSNPMFVGYRMVDSIAESMIQYPSVHAIIMPESTFCFDLHEYEKFIAIWSDGFENGTILLGAHRKSGTGFLNSVFVLRDGKVIQIYDKQHLMPFVERVPYCFDIFGCGNLFLKNNENVCAQLCDDLVMLDGQVYQIFVCSELFFQTKKVKGFPIIFLWNDAWLQFAWTKGLALKFIAYFSFKHQLSVIHASTQGRTNLRTLTPAQSRG